MGAFASISGDLVLPPLVCIKRSLGPHGAWLLLEQDSHLRPHLWVTVRLLLHAALTSISYAQPSCLSHFTLKRPCLSSLRQLLSRPTHLLLDTAQTDPAAVSHHCSGGTWGCLAREVWGAGEQRLVAVAADRLLPSESPCPSISRQGCCWWPA